MLAMAKSKINYITILRCYKLFSECLLTAESFKLQDQIRKMSITTIDVQS